jgi:alpha-tubulin suppressor-like RCC1 family protein
VRLGAGQDTRASTGGAIFGIDENGKLWGWGNGAFNQITAGSFFYYFPVPVWEGSFSTKTFCEIANARCYANAIDKDGRLWTWGATTASGPPAYVGGAIKTFCKIDGGHLHQLLIEKNGRLWSLGSNSTGQLGDNTTVSRATPVSVLGAVKTFCKIATGGTASAAIDKYGRLWTWGINSNGELGDNTTISKRTPVSVLGSTKTFCEIAGGIRNGASTGLNAFFLAIDKNGKMWSWGNNSNRSLGNGTTINRSTPVAVYGNKTFCKVAAGSAAVFAIDKNGRTWGWGTSFTGFGNNDPIEALFSPVKICGNKTFCEIAMNYNAPNLQAPFASFGIDKNGKLWGWGPNPLGIVGDNTTISRLTPVAVYGNKTFCHIACAFTTAHGIDKNGKVWSWGGSNSNGQLGNNSTISRITPTALYGNKTFCKIVGYDDGAGSEVRFAIEKNGKLWGWGGRGQILGQTSTVYRLTPIEVHANKTFCKITGSSVSALAIDKNGKIWSWGNNVYGELGDGSTITRSTPLQIYGNKTFCEIAMTNGSGGAASAAIDKNGKIWTWGINTRGLLGQGLGICEATPVNLNINKTFCKISAGTNSYLAIDKNGKIWTWGGNGNAVLGQNIPSNIAYTDNQPKEIWGGTNKTFCKITLHYTTAFGIDKNGKTWGWGAAYLGTNSSSASQTPIAVYGNKTFCEITTYFQSSSAIDKNGKAWGWGINSSGQVGDTTTLSRLTPVAVYGNKTFCKISSGSSFTLAIDNYGKIWGWGMNYIGQLGDNSTISRRTPVSISGSLKTFCEIRSGASHALAIDKNGRLWSWGNNVYGELGIDFDFYKKTPVSVQGAAKTFCKIYAGENVSIAIDKNGTAWSWGTKEFGLSANGSFVQNYNQNSTPVKIYGNKTFCEIASKGYLAIAIIDNNGKAWAWGDNSNNYFNGIGYSYTPISIKGQNKTFCQIAANEKSFIALDKNNQLWTWGYSEHQFGVNKNLNQSSTPIRIAENTLFAKIAKAGPAAINQNGQGFTWAYKTSAGINNSRGTCESTPVRICTI